jgi:hypothetical protein
MTTYTDFGASLLMGDVQQYVVIPIIAGSSDSECDDRSSSGVSSSSSLSSLVSQVSSGIGSNDCSKYHSNSTFAEHNAPKKAKVCNKSHRMVTCSKHHMDSTRISSHILGERTPCIGQETSPLMGRFLNDVESSLENRNTESKQNIDVSVYMLNPEAHEESVSITSALPVKKQHDGNSEVQKITEEHLVRSRSVNNMTGIIRDTSNAKKCTRYSVQFNLTIQELSFDQTYSGTKNMKKKKSFAKKIKSYFLRIKKKGSFSKSFDN